MVYGPKLTFSEYLHRSKYRSEQETFMDSVNRIAKYTGSSEQHFIMIKHILRDMRFLPAGRIQASVGKSRKTTPFNCFVSGTIQDSFVDGKGSIMQRAAEAAQIMRMGGGIGYDFSNLRPQGSLIKKLDSYSSGPVSFIGIFNAIGECVSSAGHRRGAQLGTLPIWHPDIEKFITVKNNIDKLTGFNLSVGVTDKFMQHLIKREKFPLTFNGKVHKYVDPVSLWDILMKSAWDWGEPGVLFLDTINNMNNLYYHEYLKTTNPCGEQPLPPYGACLLGSFNLVKYLVQPGEPIHFDPNSPISFNFKKYKADIPPIVRMMDNIIDKAIYPLDEHDFEVKSKRRMGLGITGLSNTAEILGFSYGSPGFLEFEEKILTILRDASYNASIDIAKEKAPFFLYDKDRYLKGGFINSLPDSIRKRIRKHGIRNSHLTSIAPTGTISMCADVISSGIEPVFEYESKRKVKMSDVEETICMKDYGYRFFGKKGKLARNVTPQEHVDVLTVATKFVDGAVSKTCNVDSSTSWNDFKNIYINAWKGGCKGCTTFNSDGKRMGVMTKKVDKMQTCKIDAKSGRQECE